MEKKILTSQLVGIDGLRFFLSVSILIVHFPHFLEGYTYDKSELPFYHLLSPFYKYGGFAVQIFWLISGVIFMTVYHELIESKRISFTKFIFLRLTRLYPLHLVTLCSVAVLQIFFFKTFNHYFIYSNTDVLHFLLNIVMISYWNAKFGLSFNGPFWSVSVELFVYIVFFMFAYLKMLTQYKLVFFILILFYVFYALGILSPFYECLLFFFGGCFMSKFFFSIKGKVILFLVLIALLVYAFRVYISDYTGNIFVLRAVAEITKFLIAFFIVLIFIKIPFSKIAYFNSLFKTLGNMTYSVYMIHISIQILLLLAFKNMGITFFKSEYFFIFYLFITLLIGYLVYQIFEKKAQDYLRNKFKDAF